MPICSQVRPAETGTGSQVTGEVCDNSGGGGGGYDVEALLTIDATHVDFVSCDPAPRQQVTDKGHIQIWWQLSLTINGRVPFAVKLKCRDTASGMRTPMALSICSKRGEPPNRQFFLATTHVLEHTCAAEP